MSSSDIEQASFTEIADGAWDAVQVTEFLHRVAKRVRKLERRVEEAEEMRAAAMDLVTQAEALVDQVKHRAEVNPEFTADEAERLIADAEARARQIEAEATARVRAAEHDIAAVLDRSRAEAAAIVQESERVAAQLIEGADSEYGWRRIEAAALAEDEREAMRRDAARIRELARVDAVAIVAGAHEDADRIAQTTANGEDAAPAQAEFDRIIAEAEALLESARAESELIIAEAKRRAAEVDTGDDLDAELRRSVSALRSVTDARTRLGDTGPMDQVRDRALRVLADLRHGEGRMSPWVRAELAGELHELQELIADLEAELVEDGSGTPRERIVLDLTDDAEDAPESALPTRPSRYQQRSANLPKIGSRVENINRAMRSMRDHIKDPD